MSKDSKIIVALTCLGLGLVHVFFLALVSGSLLIFYLEAPLLWLESLVAPPIVPETSPALFAANLWIGGTLFYGLVAGVPLGFVFVGIKRLLKSLNDDKWIHRA